MSKELQRRKVIRIQGQDYSQNGAYFITICVKNGYEMLGSIDVGANCVHPLLSEYGEIAEKEILFLSEAYNNSVKITKYVIMPNHIHMILVINAEESGQTQFAPTIPRILKQFKGSVTKQIGFSLWQKSYHDRIIRDESEYQKICRYIDKNPERWKDDCYYISQGSKPPHEFPNNQ